MHLLKKHEEAIIAKVRQQTDEKLIQQHVETKEQQRIIVTRPIRPRAIIIAPSRELVSQIAVRQTEDM